MINHDPEQRIKELELEIQNFKANGGATQTSTKPESAESDDKSKQSREIENLYQTLFTDGYSIKLIIDSETGQIIDVNKSACLFYGYSRDEITAMNISEINTLSDEQVREEMMAAKLNKRNHFNFRHQLKDGDIRDVEVRSGKIEVENKTYLYSDIIDVTEKKKIEQELIKTKERAEKNAEENETKYRFIVENLNDLVVKLDANKLLSYVSPKYCKTFGVKEDEILGTSFLPLVHPDDLETVRKSLENLNQPPHTTYHEERAKTVAGWRWFAWSVKAVFERNNIAEIIAVGRDISEKKQYEFELQKAKEEAQESEEKYKRLVNNSTSIIMEIDMDTLEIINCNPQLAKLFNKNVDDFIGVDIRTILPPDVLQKRIAYAEKAFQENKVQQFEDERDGRHFIHSYIPYKTETKRFLQTETHDITLLEEAKQELIRAKEEAENANRLKSEFLQNMSHEIRTPLNGIMGFSEILCNPRISDEKRNNYSKIIRNSGQQLLRIVDDILEISTLETKQSKLNETEFCLNQLLTELYAVFSLKSEGKDVPIYLEKPLHDKEAYIISDKTKLNKILSNLIENAIKFTPSGSIEIGYRIENAILKIYVRDTGIGISAENQQKIFERFSQENKEIAGTYGGLGLGLSICKENAALLGGEITLESQKGNGSTFIVTIPYKPAGDSTPDKNKNTPENKKADGALTILVAEDEEMNYLYIEALFEEEIETNCNLIHARNGREALDICMENQDINLVLMDIKMPVMNGNEATLEIKERFPGLPVIAQTAYSTESEKAEAMKHGYDDFMSKPLDKDRLLEAMNKFMRVK
jgi:PAS domain S-box-containing protein